MTLNSLKLFSFYLLTILLGNTHALHAQFYYKDPCTEDFGLFTPHGDASYTSGNVDPAGNGWLRVTNNGYYELGYIETDRTFPSTMGVVVEFDFKVWNTSTTYPLADGFSVFLFDGSQPLTIGQAGGSLGYSGLNPAYLGVGIDEYGNFSNPGNQGFPDGPGFSPNSIAVRNATYNYVAGKALTTTLQYPYATPTRPQDNVYYRRVKVEITPAKSPATGMDVTVSLITQSGNSEVIIGLVNIPNTPPELLKVGFAGSTGAYTAYHEVRNVIIRTPQALAVIKKLNCADSEINTLIYKGDNLVLSDIMVNDTLPAGFIPTSIDITGGTFSLSPVHFSTLSDGRKVYTYTVNSTDFLTTITFNGDLFTQRKDLYSSVGITPPIDFVDDNLDDNYSEAELLYNSDSTVIICQNDLPYVFRDTTFQTGTISGDYIFNRKTVEGCDSIVTLHLTVNPVYDLDSTVIICQSDLPYVFRDTTFQTGTISGDYIFNRETVEGCDSIVTLHLTINPVYDLDSTAIICQSDLPYVFRDTTFQTGTISGDYIFNRETIEGCDSIVTLHLTVNPVYNLDSTAIICQSDLPYVFRDTTFQTGTISGDYIFNRETVEGCDSIFTLHLTVNDLIYSTDTQVACVNYTWIDEVTYIQSNSTATYTLSSLITGCDSIITLNLTINDVVYGTDTQTACVNYTWIDGVTYTQSNNTATYTLSSLITGCDSIVTLNLTINDVVYGTDTQIACVSYTWIDGVTYTQSNNTAIYTLSSLITGCDSIVTLDLTINDVVYGTDTQVACVSYTWIDGVTYTQNNNTATYTLSSLITGCDSIVTLDLTINDVVYGTDTQAACVSYTWIDGVTYIQSNNTATYTLSSLITGCDSIVTLDLTISDVLYSTDTQTACVSYTWIDGVTYTQSNNTATYTLSSLITGCDSIVTLNLTINDVVYGTDTQVACAGYTWIDGVTYTQNNNTATYTLSSLITGCDSIVTLDLTVNDVIYETDTQVACTGYTWIDGVTYTQSNNTATYILSSLITGCDSIVTLNLTINDVVYGTDTQVACESYTWIDGVTYTQSNNTATHTLTGVIGCDSIVTLHLTVQPLNEQTFTVRIPVNEPYNANGFSVPPQQKLGTFTFTDERRSEDALGCDSVITLHLTVYAEIGPDKFFTPNGDGIRDFWNIQYIEYFEVSTVDIYDRFGKLLVRYTGKFTPWDGTYLGIPMPSTDYWYVITLEEVEKIYVGHFTLLR